MSPGATQNTSHNDHRTVVTTTGSWAPDAQHQVQPYPSVWAAFIALISLAIVRTCAEDYSRMLSGIKCFFRTPH